METEPAKDNKSTISEGELREKLLLILDTNKQEVLIKNKEYSSLLYRFNHLFQFLLKNDLQMICLDGNNPMPIDILGTFMLRLDTFERNYFVEYIYSLVNKWELKTIMMDLNESKRIFIDGFLKAFRNPFESEAKSIKVEEANNKISILGPGGTDIYVKVNSINSGLPILCTHAYFPNLNNRFGGSLSTPVYSSITPGIYKFGARMNGKPILEPDEHDIKRDCTIDLYMV